MPLRSLSSVHALVWLCACANFLNQADRTLMSFAIVPISREYHVPHVERGWILSSFTFGYVATQAVAGVVILRRGHTMNVLTCAVFLWSVCTLLTPLCVQLIAFGSYAPLLLCRTLMGAAEGFCWPCTIHIVNTSTDSSARAFSMSILVVGGSVGMLLSILCSHLAWATQFFLLGSAGVLWSAVARFTAPPMQEVHLRADFSFLKAYRLLFTHSGLIAIYVSHFSHNAIYYAMFIWLPTYLNEVLGVPRTALTVLALPMFVASIVGPLHGAFFDRIWHKWQWTTLRGSRIAANVVCVLLPGLCALALTVTSHSLILSITVLCLVYSFAAANSAGYMSNHGDIVPKGTALSYGVSNTFGTLPGVLAGPLGAQAIAAGHWNFIFLVPALIGVFGTVYYAMKCTVAEDATLSAVLDVGTSSDDDDDDAKLAIRKLNQVP